MVAYILIAIVAYLFGSLPFAYILTRRRHRLDLRTEGSRNIGTMNAYEVSGSRKTGIAVLFLDMLKALIPVVLVQILFRDSFFYAAVAWFFVVLGHNYSLWLRGKGGRGLAPAAGGALALNPLLPVLWGIVWYVAYKGMKNIHGGNIVATIALGLAVWFVGDAISITNIVPDGNIIVLQIVTGAVCVLILVKHIEPVLQIIHERSITEIHEPE